MITSTKRRAACVGMLVVCAFASSRGASLTLVTSRSLLGADDLVDWGNLGPELSSPSNPFTLSSALGISVTGSTAGRFERRNEPTSWDGNFANGDKALWTTLGPITLQLGTGVFGAGLQIQRDAFGSFTGNIQAFDSIGNSLGSFSESGNSNGNADNSAIFIGVLSDTVPITKLQFNISGNVHTAFAVNEAWLHLIVGPNSWASSTGGKWESASDWSLTAAPSGRDTQNFLTNATTKIVTIDATTSGSFPSTMTISNLTVSAPSGSTNTLFLDNAGLTTPLRMRNDFTVSNGGAVVVQNSTISADDTATGAGIVNGLMIGESGRGHMLIEGGTVQGNDIIIGVNPGSQGTLTQAGGITTLSGAVRLGYFNGGTGNVLVTGGQILVTNSSFIVGDA